MFLLFIGNVREHSTREKKICWLKVGMKQTTLLDLPTCVWRELQCCTSAEHLGSAK